LTDYPKEIASKRKVNVPGGATYTAEEIDRLHVAPKKKRPDEAWGSSIPEQHHHIPNKHSDDHSRHREC
jgi:hypothetical protein